MVVGNWAILGIDVEIECPSTGHINVKSKTGSLQINMNRSA